MEKSEYDDSPSLKLAYPLRIGDLGDYFLFGIRHIFRGYFSFREGTLPKFNEWFTKKSAPLGFHSVLGEPAVILGEDTEPH